MSCDNKFHIDVNGIVRSVAVVAVGLPLTLSISGTLNAITRAADSAAAQSKQATIIETLKGDATEACLDWLLSDVDSKLERNAKNELDEVFDGEVNHSEVCKYVL